MRNVYDQIKNKYDVLDKDTRDAMAKQVATYNESVKKMEELGKQAETASRNLENVQFQAAAKQQSLDQQLTQWSQNTPTREATYAMSMHLAAPLSILTAIG